MNVSREKKNYWAFLLDGGFYIGGMSFVNTQTLLPGIIAEQGGPSWLAAIAPFSVLMAFCIVPIFTAGLVDRLEKVKWFVLHVSTFQRMPFLIAALLLLIPGFGEKYLIWIISATPLASGIIGGVCIAAFQRLYIRCVPTQMRASNMAFRFMIGGLMGVAAGETARYLLAEYTVADALSILHFIAFGWVVLSYVALAFAEEPAPTVSASKTDAAGQNAHGPWKSIQDIRMIFLPGPQRKSVIAFIVTLFCLHGFAIAVPKFSAFLQQTAGQPVDFLGTLSTWSMVGNALGTLSAAWIGDRFGGRFTLALGAFGVFVTLAMTPFVEGVPGVCAIYALFSFSLLMMVVGKDALQMDLVPQERVAHFLSAYLLFTFFALLLTTLLHYALWEAFHSFKILAWTGAGFSIGAIVAVSYVKEPRPDVAQISLAKVRRGILRYFR